MKTIFVIIFVMYTALISLYICYQAYSIIKFKVNASKLNATFLLDAAYLTSILAFNTICFSAIYHDIYTVFSNLTNLNYYETQPLPFFIYATPLVVILSAMTIKEGMFAYTSEALYDGKKVRSLSTFKLISIHKYRLFNRAKITLEPINGDLGRAKRVFVRTSQKRAEKFIEALQHQR